MKLPAPQKSSRTSRPSGARDQRGTHEERVRAAVRLLEDVGPGALQPGGEVPGTRACRSTGSPSTSGAPPPSTWSTAPPKRRYRADQRLGSGTHRGRNRREEEPRRAARLEGGPLERDLARREPDLGERRPDDTSQGVEALVEQVTLAEPHRRVRAPAEEHEPAARAVEVELRARPVPERRRRADDGPRLVAPGLEPRDPPERFADVRSFAASCAA